MQNLNLTRTATVTNVNPRKELHGEDDELAIDINLKIEGAASDVLALVCNPEKLISSVWDEENGYLVEPRMKSIKLDIKYENHAFTALETTLEGCKIGKFVITPADGHHVCIGFQVQGYPSSEQVAELCELIGESVDIAIEPLQNDLVEEQQEAA